MKLTYLVLTHNPYLKYNNENMDCFLCYMMIGFLQKVPSYLGHIDDLVSNITNSKTVKVSFDLLLSISIIRTSDALAHLKPQRVKSKIENGCVRTADMREDNTIIKATNDKKMLVIPSCLKRHVASTMVYYFK